MPLDEPIPMIGTGSEFTIPETLETLLLQQRALLDGRRAVQMFPNGTSELPAPMGFNRVITSRGIFHYDPQQITAHRVVEASICGRENEILGLGPYSKSDVVDAGGTLVAVVERAPNGVEVLAAMSNAQWAGEVMVEMKRNAGRGHVVTIESPDLVIRGRTAAGRS